MKDTKYVIEIDHDRPMEEFVYFARFDDVRGYSAYCDVQSTANGVIETKYELLSSADIPTREGRDHFFIEDFEDYFSSENGLRAATVAEIIAFGGKYPDVQRKFPIIATGSILWYRIPEPPFRVQVVPRIFYEPGYYAMRVNFYGVHRHFPPQRVIALCKCDSKWSFEYRVLAVHK